MKSKEFELKADQIMKRLALLQPGDRLVFDTMPGYSAAPAYPDDAERRAVTTLVSRMLGEGKGMVFHRRIKVGDGRSYIVREFVSVRPETIFRLVECLERIPLPSIKNRFLDGE